MHEGRPEEGRRRRGAELGDDGDGGRCLGLDFGRGRPRPRSWRDGGASGWGRATQSVRNRSGAAKLGRWNVDGELCSLPLAVLRGRRREERDGTGSFEASAWLRAALNAEVGRDCRRVDALAGDHSGGMGVGAQYRAHERHCLLV